MMLGAGISEIIIMFLMGLGVGVPVGVPPLPEDPQLLRIAPEETIYYTYWAGMADPDPTSEHPTVKMLADEEILHVVEKLKVALEIASEGGMSVMEPEEKAAAAPVLRLAKMIPYRPMALYLSGLNMVEGELTFSGGAAINVGEEASDLITEFVSALTNLGVEPTELQAGDFVIYEYLLPDTEQAAAIASHDGYIFLATGAEELQAMTSRTEAEKTNWMTASESQLKFDRVSSRSYIDIEEVLDFTAESMGDPDVRRVLNGLGVTGVTSYLGGTGLTETGFSTKMQIELNEDANGLVELLNGGGLTRAGLQNIPEGAPAAISLNLSAEVLYEVVQNVMNTIEPGSSEMLEGQMEEVGGGIGIDIRNELINSFGDQLTIYAAPDDGGLISGWTAAVEVDNPMVLSVAFEKLMAMLKDSLEGERGPQLHVMSLEGENIYSMSFPNELPLTPSWCLRGDELLFSLFPQAIKSRVRGEKMPSNSIANRAMALESFSGDRSARVVAYSQINHAELIRTFYPYVQFFGQFMMSELQNEGVEFSLGDLPSIASLTDGVEPGFTVVRRTATGLEIETHQTIPSGEIGTVGPIAIAALLPAIGSARLAARRTQSLNNMKQILISFHNYHDVHKGLPASYSVDDDGKPLLSWRVHILPYVEQQALYEQFHLDEPWDSDHNIRLVEQMPAMYALPGSDATLGKTVYQVPRGRNLMFDEVNMSNIERARRALGPQFRDVTDGLSNTIALVETNEANAVIWTKPDDLTAPEMGLMERLQGNWTGVFLVGMGDGSVRSMPTTVSTETLMKLLTRDGGETIDWSETDPSFGMEPLDFPEKRPVPADFEVEGIEFEKAEEMKLEKTIERDRR